MVVALIIIAPLVTVYVAASSPGFVLPTLNLCPLPTENLNAEPALFHALIDLDKEVFQAHGQLASPESTVVPFLILIFLPCGLYRGEIYKNNYIKGKDKYFNNKIIISEYGRFSRGEESIANWTKILRQREPLLG